MTQKDYEQKRREYWEDVKALSPFQSREAFYNYVFDRAYALGKQEKDADAVIQGWVARDSNGSLYFYHCNPERVRLNSNDGLWMSETLNELNSYLFPDLTWESDPIEVELTIKRKKNG